MLRTVVPAVIRLNKRSPVERERLIPSCAVDVIHCRAAFSRQHSVVVVFLGLAAVDDLALQSERERERERERHLSKG